MPDDFTPEPAAAFKPPRRRSHTSVIRTVYALLALIALVAVIRIRGITVADVWVWVGGEGKAPIKEPNKEPARSEPVVSAPDLRLKELETENKGLKDHLVEMVMRPDARLKELEMENKRLRNQLVESIRPNARLKELETENKRLRDQLVEIIRIHERNEQIYASRKPEQKPKEEKTDKSKAEPVVKTKDEAFREQIREHREEIQPLLEALAKKVLRTVLVKYKPDQLMFGKMEVTSENSDAFLSGMVNAPDIVNKPFKLCIEVDFSSGDPIAVLKYLDFDGQIHFPESSKPRAPTSIVVTPIHN